MPMIMNHDGGRGKAVEWKGIQNQCANSNADVWFVFGPIHSS